MEESILSDAYSYSGGSEVGLEDVYYKSETLADNDDVLSRELDNVSNAGMGYALEGAESSYPINEPRNVYEGVEPLPENTPISEPVNHYLDSARRLNQSDESSSDSGSISSKTDKSSWNERFQRIYSTANSLEKFLALGKLVKDFVDTAQTYAKVIISESSLPISEKTIKPKLDIGIAGGDKYICAGILFKYATDKELSSGFWMYGGDGRKDEYALKSANHEMKGIISYLNTGVKELCLPLMAVIDYAGVRLVAVALLPINDTTLRYGSNNAGRTIYNSDKKLNMYIERVAKKLNIKGHPVGLLKKVLFGPGDLEGHCGEDDRYYVLDFARLYPPEPPSKRNMPKRATWFNLLRPELVASNQVPLSPDAYSCFESEESRAASRKEIVDATIRLYKSIVPQFAKNFDDAHITSQDSISHVIIDHSQLTENLHRAGINIRHLGFVLQNTRTQAARSIILTEMVARVIKNECKRAFRDQSMLFSSRDKIQEIILDQMNSITDVSSLSYERFWTTQLHVLLKDKFQYDYVDDPLNADVDIETLVDKRVLIDKLEIMTGFKLTNAAKQSFFESGTAVLREVDIKSIEPRVKHLNIVDYAEGAVYMYLSKRFGDRETDRRRQYLQNAIKSFASALSAAPFDGTSCYKLARCLHKLAELELDNRPFGSLVKQASEKYQQSIHFGYSPEKVLQRRGELLLLAAGRTNEEKYYQLAGESYQQAFKYPSCMRIINELFERANEEQGEQLLNTLKLSLYCPVLQQQFANELRRIDMSNSVAFSQAELLQLFSELKQVKEVLAHATKIDDEFVEFAVNKWPGLERLDVSGILNITDRGLAAISKCSALQYLNLDKMGLISNEGLIKLSKGCTNIEELSISHCTQITEACLMQVVDNLPNLQHFHCIVFKEMLKKMFTNEGFVHLLRPGTKTLRVSVHPLEEEGAMNFIQKIRQTGAKIEHLAMIRSSEIERDPEFQSIPDTVFIPLFTELQYLKSIEIRRLSVTDDAMRFLLTHCTNLEKIIVDIQPGSDLSCEWLDAVTPSNNKLEHLELTCLVNESPRMALIKQLATSCPRLTKLKADCFYFAEELIAISNCFPYMQSLDLDCGRSFHIDDIVIRLCCDSWRNLTHLKLFACDHVGGFSQSLLTLSKNAPNLKSLSLQVVDEISPQCLVEFFYQPKPKITRLNLFKCTPVNDEAMAKILPLVPNLTHLNLSFTRVTNKTVKLIGECLPKLRKLIMNGIAGLSDSVLIEASKSLPHLRDLRVGEQMSLKGECGAYFALYCDNLQRVSMRVSEDLYIDPSVPTSHLACAAFWRAKIMFLYSKKIQGPMRLEMLKKSAQILSRMLYTMPECLNDYKAFWLSYSEKKMSADDLHQYIYMLEYCPQIINLLKSYWEYHPNNDLLTHDSIKLTWNSLVRESTLTQVLSALTQPISLHVENCMKFNPDATADLLASFQFKSLHLSNDYWQLYHQSIPKLSTLSASTLVSLQALDHIDLHALDVAKFSNLTHLDVSFRNQFTVDASWGDGELTAVLSSCKALKRIDFTGRLHASASALNDGDAASLSFEEFRADKAVSLADASKLLQKSPSLRTLKIRIGADGGLERIIIANLVSLELFESRLTSDMLTSLTACQNLKELSLQQCAFGADTHDAFKTLFGSLTLSKLVIEPTNGRDLTQQVFESITQQSQLEHFEIGFHPCPRWQLWVPFIGKNVSLKHLIIRYSATVHFVLDQIIPLLPPLETLEGVSLDDNHLRIIAQNSQKTLKKLRCSSTELTECTALSLCRDIEVLHLSNCNIKDEDFMHVTSCLSGRLREVNLSQCKNISPDTITALLKQCPQIRVMNLSGCVRLTDALLPSLEKYGHCLEVLDLTGCPLISPEKVDQMRMFSILRLVVTRSPFSLSFAEGDRQTSVNYDNLFKALARKVCTRSLIKNESMKQEATYCNTCQAVVCKSCLIKCHKGHEVNDEEFSYIICECPDSCKCQK